MVAAYHDRIINIHPALLPAYGGHGMFGHHVHEAVLAAGEHFSGATVHYVDEEFDRGKILLQERVAVMNDDTPDTLAARILEVEHKLLPMAVRHIAALQHNHIQG
ncbi:MAG: formyltransferase family protein [Ignavibacteriales bacterium]|nr:formyltransferase family protein [Ignavibacteriales bacterium]